MQFSHTIISRWTFVEPLTGVPLLCMCWSVPSTSQHWLEPKADYTSPQPENSFHILWHESSNDPHVSTASWSSLPCSSFLLPHRHNGSVNLLLVHQITQCWSDSGFINSDVSPAGVLWTCFKNPVNTFWRNHETLIQLINETSLFCFQHCVSPRLFFLYLYHCQLFMPSPVT